MGGIGSKRFSGDVGKHPAMNPFVLIPQHIAQLALRASWRFARFKHWPRVKRRAVPATAPYGRFSALRALVLPQARQEAAGSQRASMRSSAAAPRRDSPCRFPFHAFSCASSLSASLSCGRSIAFAGQSAASGGRSQPASRQVLIITQRTRARSPPRSLWPLLVRPSLGLLSIQPAAQTVKFS